MSEVISARVSLNDYSNRVLGVIKAKYNLKDKSEALNKFIDMYGTNEVEPELKEEYVQKILELEKNYKSKPMSKKEFDSLFE
ncbi:MAG: DUF2683 family protein [Candidatus ainarchaeum sp.]|nr:DUF2683 family protein [Candidatus ainarchaeum sp.]